MGDQLNVEEIMAEEEEVSVFQKVLSLGKDIIYLIFHAFSGSIPK